MSSDLLLSQVLQGFYLARRADGYSAGTIQQYDWALSRWLKFLGDKPMRQVSIEDARRFIVYLQTDYGSLSPTSIFHAWKAIRALYKWASAEMSMPNIATGLKPPKFQAPEIVPLTNVEIEKLLQTAVTVEHKDKTRQYQRKTQQGERNRALILFLLDTGLRVGELCRLNLDDLNMETGEATVKPFQSSRKSKPRTVYFGRRAQKELWRYLVGRKNDLKNEPLFLSAEGRRLTGDAVKHILDRIGKRAGVERVHPHIFRHTFAIQYLRNGGDVFTLQRLMGHSSLKMVERYLNIARTDLEAAHRRASPVDNWRL